MDLNREFYEKLAKYTIEYEEKHKRIEMARLDKMAEEMKLEKPMSIDQEKLYKLITKISPNYKGFMRE